MVLKKFNKGNPRISTSKLLTVIVVVINKEAYKYLNVSGNY